MKSINFKILYLSLSIVLFFSCGYRYVNADFEITEVMYDLDGTDTDREWVEVRNTGDTSADLSKWYLFSDNTKHTLAPVSDTSVASGGYAVIAQNPTKFKIDNPTFVGLLFDSSWTGFANDGDTLALKDQALVLYSEVVFSSSLGANGDGKSLQKSAGVWIASNPTPGSGVSGTSNTNTDTNTGDSGTSNTSTNSTTGGSGSSTSSTTIKKETSTPIVTTDIIIPSTTLVAGLPYIFNHKTIGYSKERITYGYFFWNFGDGYTQIQNNAEGFTYTYPYEGEYVLSLSYKNNEYNPVPLANDRVLIKVVPNNLIISSVGDSSDPYVELDNKGKYEIDVSDFILQGSIHSFTIPKGTIIMQGRKLKLSPSITGFDFNDISSVSILNPRWKLLSVYPVSVAPSIKKMVNYPNTNYNKPKISVSNIKKEEVVDLNALSASVGDTKSKLDVSKYAWVGLALIIILGLLATVFLKKEDNTKKDDIEKELNANDFSILE